MSRKPAKKKQDERIAIEIEKLESLFVDQSEEVQSAAKRLIERVAFMTITLEILESNIKTKGPTYLFKNGKQEMYVENPAQKSYNTMINRYTSAYSSLLNLLPKKTIGNSSGDEDDGFDNF